MGRTPGIDGKMGDVFKTKRGLQVFKNSKRIPGVSSGKDIPGLGRRSASDIKKLTTG